MGVKVYQDVASELKAQIYGQNGTSILPIQTDASGNLISSSSTTSGTIVYTPVLTTAPPTWVPVGDYSQWSFFVYNDTGSDIKSTLFLNPGDPAVTGYYPDSPPVTIPAGQTKIIQANTFGIQAGITLSTIPTTPVYLAWQRL